MNRPAFLLALTASAPTLGSNGNAAEARFEAEERRGSGRLGVAAIDLRTGRRIGRRGAERFPLASTFKVPLVMCVLKRVDAGRERLARDVRFTARDVLAYSPVVAGNVRKGSLTVGELCAAAIEESDNAAANLLLRSVGGPPGVDAYLRSVGDTATRLDRSEPALNVSIPGDPRDTTTPDAMANLLARLVRDPVLSPGSKALLFGWMRAAKTGLTRLRAGVPPGWIVGDKTGTTDTAANDIAILWPPSGAPVVIAAYFAGVKASEAERDAAIASVARTALASFRRPV
ncbi:MAG TPA: class A beta-lactamase [Candidatus Elarobacter sp.]|jgi:beta-lactamase class A